MNILSVFGTAFTNSILWVILKVIKETMGDVG